MRLRIAHHTEASTTRALCAMRRTPHAARHAWRTMGSSPQALCSRRMAPCTASIASCAILNPQGWRAREAAECNRIRGPPRGCGEPPAAARQAKARVDKPAVYPLRRFLYRVSTPRRQIKRAYNFICTLMRELTCIACVLPFSGAARSAAFLSHVLSPPRPSRVRRWCGVFSPRARRPGVFILHARN